jgi:3-mercaptopyruvate sulfurtransferase SseA
VLLHVGERFDYNAGHVPGARFLPYDAVSTSVLAHDTCLLTLDYLGLSDRTSILDGGLSAWKANGRPITTAVPPPRAGR